MAIADELVAVLKVDNSQLLEGLKKAQAGLQDIQKAMKEASEDEKRLADAQEKARKATAEATKDTRAASEAFKKFSGSLSSVRSSFLSLRTIMTGFLVGTGISRLTESVTKISNLSQITGQSVGSIRALGNVFEQLGYSAGEANATIQSISDALAKARYGGGLSGALIPMTAFGIQMFDKEGNPRDTAEMLIELGEAVRKSSRNIAEARMKLKAMGYSNADIAFMTADNARELLARERANAAAFEKQAEAARKLNAFIKQLGQTFTSLGVQALPVVEPVVKDVTEGLQKLVNVANEHPEGAQMAIKAIGLAALAAKGPIGMLVAGLLALRELYEQAKDWLENGNELQKNVVSGEYEGNTVDPSNYNVDPKSKKTGDWGTGFYKTANGWLDTGIKAFREAWGDDPVAGGMPGNNSDLREKIRQNLMQREGVSLDAYQDSKGIWTIGYGHTRGVKRGDRITKEQAAAFLAEDMKTHIDPALEMYAGHSDKTKMLAADLAYNAGLSSIQKGSQFWKLAQQGEISQSDYAKLYNYSGRKFVPGLVNRRNATYVAASGLSGGSTPQMLAMAKAQPSVVNNTSNQTITNNIGITVPSVKEAKEIAGQYTSGQKTNQRMASGATV